MGSAFRPVGPVERLETAPDGVDLWTGCERVEIRFLDDEILRVTMTRRADRGDVHPGTGAVVYSGAPTRRVKVNGDGGRLCLESPGLHVTISTNPLNVDLYRPDGRPVCLERPGEGMGWQGTGAGCRKVLEGSERFYGFGERTGYLDKRGSRMTLWNSDVNPYLPSTDSMYVSIPFFMVLSGPNALGVFLDSPAKTRFDMGKERADTYSYFTNEGRLDYYVFSGPTMKDVLAQYTRLTGRISMPPMWALGYHQSRYSYYPDTQVLQVAQAMRKHDIPCDALYLDIHYMSGYRVFTFDERRFADPRELVDRLNEMGFKLVCIVDPGVKIDDDYGPFRRGLAEAAFISGPDGEPTTVRVWPGDVHLPDFSRAATRRWWAREHKPLFDAGVSGIWNDMNEPAAFDVPGKTAPLESIHGETERPVRHELEHNLYANRMAEATALAFEEFLPGKRPFIISRAGYAGIQRYACTWTGDNSSWWEHLLLAMPMCLNLGLSGQPFVGTDIGGFLFDSEPELVARWTQLGAFMPLFRNHSAIDTTPQEPYALPEPYRSVCREAIRFRYRLLPYLYSLMHEASMTGRPPMRPMTMEFPGDERCHRLYDQFMFGRDLLVAPVYLKGAECRPVYLPGGQWVDFHSGSAVAGERFILADAPLGRIPLYVRQGAILPFGRAMSHTGEKPQTVELLDVYPPGQPHADFDMYVDDGATMAYRQGDWGIFRFSYDENRSGLTIRAEWDWKGHACDRPLEKVRVATGVRVPASVKANGAALRRLSGIDEAESGAGWYFAPEADRLYVGVHQLVDKHEIEVEWE